MEPSSLKNPYKPSHLRANTMLWKAKRGHETEATFTAVAQEFPIDKKNRDAEVALSRIPEFKAVTKVPGESFRRHGFPT